MQAPAYHRLTSCALTGLDGVPVEIEVSILPGLPNFDISGRGDPAIRESRDRVRAALCNSGYHFPKGRVIASYAPASLPKQGSAFDLPLALAILAASSQIVAPAGRPSPAFLGELALNGRIKPVQGLISRLLALGDQGIRTVIGPEEGRQEASLVEAVNYEGVRDLREAVKRFSGIRGQARPPHAEPSAHFRRGPGLLQEIAGQEEGIRACVIAAAGWHPLLLMGAPGCGKTLLASVLPEILPPLRQKEILEVLRIHSAVGREGLPAIRSGERPFRQTHHSATVSALIGGGSRLLPGECSLAHKGVLFLDEVTEMKARVLDALREPLESQAIPLARAGASYTFPADFLLIAACNPCRCGFLLEPGNYCRCPDKQVARHLSRISGPLFDRFDLVALLTRVESRLLVDHAGRVREADKAEKIKEQVAAAWALQEQRAAGGEGSRFHNSRLTVQDPGQSLLVPDKVLSFASGLADSVLLSARSFYSLLRVARTISDLKGSEYVTREAVAEAFHYKAQLPWPGKEALP